MYLYFRRPDVAMYLFKLWNEQKDSLDLPKYCDKNLKDGCAVQIGATDENSTYVLPTTPRNPTSSASLTSPNSHSTPTTTTSSTNSIDTIASFLSHSMIVKKDVYCITGRVEMLIQSQAPLHDDFMASLISKHSLSDSWPSGEYCFLW